MVKPEWILGLVLVDPAGRSAGFREWGEEKVRNVYNDLKFYLIW